LNTVAKSWWTVLSWWALALPLFAHDVGLSLATVRISSTNVTAEVAFAVKDVAALEGLDVNRDGRVDQPEFELKRTELDRVFTRGLQISADGVPVAPSAVSYQLDAADNLEVDFLYDPVAARSVEIALSYLKSWPAGHRTYVTVLGPAEDKLAERLMDKEAPPMVVLVSAAGAHANAPPRSFFGFVLLGVEHIGTGYDHLLFLFGLLLVARNLRSSLVVITSFTIAHSITLGVATLNLVSLRPSLTEPLIALSIVYVGVENLLTRGEPKGRWLLTFAFGLVHGFGFASVLRDLGVSSAGGVALPLFSFNLGVEIGQLAVAAILLPVIWKLRRNEMFLRRVIPGCCVVIVAVGGFWFWQRVWGS
jgi:hydrogenase/urease accessory protein HupE